MKLDKLARQIRRDMLASPKKAAALSLMILVALYFWAPMVWGWIAPGQGAAENAVAAGDVILEDEAAPARAGTGTSKQVFPWAKVRKQLLADPRMRPRHLEAGWLDPFRAVAKEVAASASDPHAAVAALAVVEPASVGLKLSSVAIGSRRRMATISGESYSEGEIVKPATKSGEPSSDVEFRLARVDRHGVELERDGRLFKLEFPRASLAQGDEITRTGPDER
ncbi:MAG: hypothetical protein WD872_14675 [Pirellulaceae bacterium]